MEKFLPMRVNDTETASQILQLFPEIQSHYGDSIETYLSIDLSADEDFLSFRNQTGVEVGLSDRLHAQLQVFCKNDSLPDF